MPFGKTLEEIEQRNINFWRRTKPRPQKKRDRSLNGKARVKSRKAANKMDKNDE